MSAREELNRLTSKDRLSASEQNRVRTLMKSIREGAGQKVYTVNSTTGKRTEVTPTSTSEIKRSGARTRAEFERSRAPTKVVATQVIQSMQGVQTNILTADNKVQQAFVATPQKKTIIQGQVITGFAPAPPVTVPLPLPVGVGAGFAPSAQDHPFDALAKLINPSYQQPAVPAGMQAINQFFGAVQSGFTAASQAFAIKPAQAQPQPISGRTPIGGTSTLVQPRAVQQIPTTPAEAINISEMVSVSTKPKQPLRFGTMTIEEVLNQTQKPRTPPTFPDDPFGTKRGGGSVMPQPSPVPPTFTATIPQPQAPTSGGGFGEKTTSTTVQIFPNGSSTGGGFDGQDTQTPTFAPTVPDMPGGGGFPDSPTPPRDGKCRDILGREVPCGGDGIFDRPPAGAIISGAGNLLWLLLLLLLLASNDNDKKRKGANLAMRRLK